MKKYKVTDFIGLPCRHKFVDKVFYKYSEILGLGTEYSISQKGKVIRVVDTKTGEYRCVREDRLEEVNN